MQRKLVRGSDSLSWWIINSGVPEVLKAQPSTALEVSQAENMRGVHAEVGGFDLIKSFSG